MDTRRPGTVLSGALPAGYRWGALPEVDGLTTTGLAVFVDRGVSLASLACLIPALGIGMEHSSHIDRAWLMVVAGALLAAGALMPVYAWSRRGIRPLAGLYAVAALLGQVTWPLAWTGSGPASYLPPLMVPLAAGIVCAWIAISPQVGLWYAAAAGVTTFLVCLSPSGGGATLPLALQDAGLTVVQSLAIMFVLERFRRIVAALDLRLARRHAESADAAVNRALVDERRRLDAIIHDEVLTTLVAGARSQTPFDPHLALQARHAIESLRGEAMLEPSAAPISVDQFVRLVKDITVTVCPQAEVLGEIPGATLTLPQSVVRPLLQATREAALNAAKHSDATHVQVLTHVTATGRRISVRVSITDNGRGFDKSRVAPERLGIRFALEGRMQAIGGRAEVISARGRGTSVRLTWAGDRARPLSRPQETIANVSQHPLFIGVDRTPLLWFVITLMVLFIGCGAATAAALPRPDLFVGAMAIVGLGALIGLPILVRSPLFWWQGWALAGCAVGATALSLAATNHDVVPDNTKWFVAPITLLLITAFGGGQRAAAWAGASCYTVMVLAEAAGSDQPLPRTIVAAFAPLAWLVMEAAAFGWLDSIWAAIDDAEQSAIEAADLNAAMFSKLVLREVWLAELRAEIDPVLGRLAEPRSAMTDEDRAGFLLLERSLRDGIKASNFNSPGLSTAIMDARLRGVEVTLVDNRGSRLPDPARRAALRHLENVVRSADSGRIVARTAPEGYSEVVTIMQVVASGAIELTKVAEDGTVTPAVSSRTSG